MEDALCVEAGDAAGKLRSKPPELRVVREVRFLDATCHITRDQLAKAEEHVGRGSPVVMQEHDGE